MKLSTKSTYGLRALIILAKNHPKAMSIADIAQAEAISAKYLEAIFARLKKAGIVNSIKGAAGGYTLSQAPDQLNLWQLLQCLEDELLSAYCLSGGAKVYCQDKCHCGVGRAMNNINQSLAKSLQKISLQDLL